MSFVITSNRLPALAAAMEAKVARAVGKTALDIQADAQTRAPVDTGNLRGSAYARAVERLTWQVGFSAGYAVFVELGTSRMRAQPYLVPAFIVGRRRLTDAVRSMGLLS